MLGLGGRGGRARRWEDYDISHIQDFRLQVVKRKDGLCAGAAKTNVKIMCVWGGEGEEQGEVKIACIYGLVISE